MISMLTSLISDAFTSWFQKIVNFVLGFLAIIPQFMYFIYTSCASFLDFLQYLIRKLAGLDVYYVNGQPVQGDIVVSFIKGILGIESSPAYSALSTTFWSLVIFGVMLLVLTTIFSIIKAHYNYDSKKSHPMTIIGQSIKSLTLMAIVPIVAILGLYLSEIILKSLDTITSQQEAGQSAFVIEIEEKDDQGNLVYDENGVVKTKKISTLSEGFVYNEEAKSYASYDFFGSVAFTSTSTFSGALFKTAAYNCNRVREGSYSVPTSKDFDKWSNFGVFYTTESGDEAREIVASQIDYAFSNCLTLQEANQKNAVIAEDSWVLTSSYMYGYGAITALGLIKVKNFSKFNIGLVYYYYNLWGFNFLIAFAGVIAFLVILGNIVFGLITRLIQLLALFLVFPPLIGITPLDDGNAFKSWKKQFISDVLMAYGAIIGMNLFFLILPFLNTITFFNVLILDRIMNMLIMLAGLTMVSKLISMLSGFAGGSDANKTGEDTRKAVGELGGKAINTTLKAADLGLKVGKGATRFYGAAGKGAVALGGKIGAGLSEAHYKSLAKKELTKDYMKRGLSKTDAKAWAASREDDIENKVAELKQKRFEDKQDKAAQRQVNRDHRQAVMQNFKENTKFGKGLVKFGRGVSKAGRGVTAGLVTALGGNVERKDDGTVDAGKTWKAFGEAKLKLAGATIKFGGGDILKFSAVQKKSKDVGATDSFKTFVRDALGDKIKSDSSIGKGLVTEKEKEKEQEAAATLQQKNINDTAENTKKSREALEEIANLLGKSEEHELYTKAFEYVASTGCEEPSVLAAEFGFSEEQAAELIKQMRENGDIACEDEDEKSTDEDETDDFDEDDLDFEESDEDSEDDSDGDFDLVDLFKNPEKIIEGLCFLGDVIQDTSEKICDALDESVDRVMEHDFDD